MKTNILTLRSWNTPATSYKDDESGNFRLSHHRKGVGNYHSYAMGSYYSNLRPIALATLDEFSNGEWKTWMADNPVEYLSMVKYAEQAYGKVLVGGLGLALLPQELAKNDRVKDVTIVEINPDVINLTGRYVPDNMRLINSNLWDFVEKDVTEWDFIIIDVWATSNKGEHEQLFRDEVMGKYRYIREKYPNVSITIHGFPQVSDLKVKI